jgi:hypothetical protein
MPFMLFTLYKASPPPSERRSLLSLGVIAAISWLKWPTKTTLVTCSFMKRKKEISKLEQL